jgi:glutathione S-transferase
MIDLHTWNTSNGRKVSIALEELEPRIGSNHT